jgi:signal transduction histidine kinase
MLDQARLRRVLEVGRALVSNLDLESVLQRVLEEARDLTGARYAAMGVLDARKQELERFITIGAPPEVHQAVGDLPRGRGVLGVLIQDPQLLRLHNVSEHPRSFGFPVGHPPMQSFLGVPVLVRGEAWGNLYLTDKEDAEDFDEDDEDAIELLASWAGIAIDNARAYQAEQERRLELETAVRALEATTAIARALGGETDLDRILELISKRARALVDARSVLILLDEGDDELVIRAWAGDAPRDVSGLRLRIDSSISGDVLRSGRPERASDLSTRVRFQLGEMIDAQKGLFVPLVFRGRALGVLEAFDRDDGRDFSDDDERLMLSFAASAATAVATAQSAANEALRRSLAASERERQRWARELHDETLQQLASLKVLLSGARRRTEVDKLHEVLEVAVGQIDESITDLRRLVTDLRPAALDELGLPAALEGLVERVAETAGLKATLRVSLNGPIEDRSEDGEDARPARRLPTAVEDSAYRIVQEALTNVVKHAAASRVDVVIEGDDDRLELRVSDDGKGFDPDASTSGFGLVGMRERVDLLGGTIAIEPQERRGTTIRVTLPLDRDHTPGLETAVG